MSMGQKIMFGFLVVFAFCFMGFILYQQKSHSQEEFRIYYQDYTLGAEATITDVEKRIHAKGRTSFATTVSFITEDGQEVSTSLPDNDFVKWEGSMLSILYNPNNPNQIVSVAEYEERTGLKTNN